jgi:hypothetical protein
MKYKTLMDKEGGRCRIVEDNPEVFLIMEYPKSNLEENELKILRLAALECPINSTCVSIDNQGYSTICDHKGISPAIVNSNAICCMLVNGDEMEATLKATNCPLSRNNCLECEMYRYYVVPSCGHFLLSKSHAFIRCGALEKPEME